MTEVPPGFVRVASVSDVPVGDCVGVELAGAADVALFHVGGAIHAIEDLCTHAGAKLSEGPVEGCLVTCPWHGAVFDVTTGEPEGGPAFSAARVVPVVVEGGEIYVRPLAREG